jgi:hydrogenase nickel incorporation protein HypA/HybF
VHEMSIANSVLEALEKEARRFPNGRITKAGLRIGELAGVDPGALSFCWEAIVRGTAWEPMVLEIEYSPRRHRCKRCSREFVVKDFDIACPACGDTCTVFAGGDELDLAFLEVEEDESCRVGTEGVERK